MDGQLSPWARATAGSRLEKRSGCLTGGLMVSGLLLLGLCGCGALFFNLPFEAMVALVAGIVAAAFFALPAWIFIFYIDRREREPWILVFAALIGGGVVSVGFASLMNGVVESLLGINLVALGVHGQGPTGLIDSLAFTLTAPVVEESIKGLGLLLIWWLVRPEFNSVRDGIVYGSLIGLAFLIVEFGQFSGQILVLNGEVDLVQLLILRLPLFGLNTHLLWTAICGIGVGLAAETTGRLKQIGWLVLFYALAVLGHWLSNTLGVQVLGQLRSVAGLSEVTELTVGITILNWAITILALLLVQGLFYLLLGYMLRWSGWQEIKLLQTYLADEVDDITMTKSEWDSLLSARPGSDRSLDPLTGAAARQRRQAQNKLACRKAFVVQTGRDPESDLVIRAWRKDLG